MAFPQHNSLAGKNEGMLQGKARRCSFTFFKVVISNEGMFL